jgi:phosphoenolpyruvate-protein kinase (PTS system EI component)
VEHEVDSELGAVFRAHLVMIQNPSLRNELEEHIREELVGAGRSVKEAVRNCRAV